MFDFSPQLLLTVAAAIGVGLFTASRQPGGILAALARGARGFAVRGVLALVLFAGISAYVMSNISGTSYATDDPLEKAKVGDCVAGSSESTTRLVPCGDAFAKTKIVKIVHDTPPSAAMTDVACGAVTAADSAFTVSDADGDSDGAVAYCTKTL